MDTQKLLRDMGLKHLGEKTLYMYNLILKMECDYNLLEWHMNHC